MTEALKNDFIAAANFSGAEMPVVQEVINTGRIHFRVHPGLRSEWGGNGKTHVMVSLGPDGLLLSLDEIAKNSESKSISET